MHNKTLNDNNLFGTEEGVAQYRHVILTDTD